MHPRLREWLAARIRDALADRRVADVADVLAGARADADALAARVEGAIARLDAGPFRAGMTVHAAHARHPGVQAIFARHGLPRCTDCAVGADETLAEAAEGEGLDLATLLAALDALPPVHR
ncbi:MAG: hypothetical protein ACOZNI_23175 [Myxococcota bacterium]